MGVVHSILKYLGLDQPAVEAGFTRDDRGDRGPVCGTCGVLVAYQGQAAHTRWHHG